ncbi:hypothetical protein MUN35_02550 [Hafnia paralvei]|uniref:hypothetical protein n=1 Tax=Hafnia paralvei TaxID=546367 RepID=UPI0020005233|nr:hypothetical protein [Hafnia paralvei]MCK2178583.1 hypothetical protein [Hafnia paralvei]
MENFLALLKIAFNDSASYLSWALYSLLAAYISLMMSYQKRYKGKYSRKIGIFIYSMFMLVCVPNLYFIVKIFYDTFGKVGGVISFLFAVMIVIVNSVPVALSMRDNQDNQPE